MIEKLVTIITPCYNGEKYLERYFESIINQTYSNIELIFVNDGSRDNTAQIAQKYEKKLNERGYVYKYYEQDNAGQAEAVNTALPNVTGEFLYWMDSDDYLENSSIESLVTFLQEHKEYNIVRGKVRILKDDKELGIGMPTKGEGEYIFDNYIFGVNTYGFPGTFMIRMSEFDKNVKNRKIYGTRAGQNWQILLPNLYQQKCGFVDAIVYNYNIIENSHSRVKLNTFEEEISKIDSHIDILYHVLGDIGVWEEYKEKIELLYDRRKLKAALQYNQYNYIKELLAEEKKQYKEYKMNRKYWILKNKLAYTLYRKVKIR